MYVLCALVAFGDGAVGTTDVAQPTGTGNLSYFLLYSFKAKKRNCYFEVFGVAFVRTTC